MFKTAPSNASGPEAMAGTFGVPFLGSLPLDRDLCAACEGGRPLQGSAVASEALHGPFRYLIKPELDGITCVDALVGTRSLHLSRCAHTMHA